MIDALTVADFDVLATHCGPTKRSWRLTWRPRSSRITEAGVNVEEAYEWCERVTRTEAKNFAYGIRLLRKPERQAMSAIYALARRIDDIGDGPGTPEEKFAGLQHVRKDLDPIDPKTNDPVLFAVADAARALSALDGMFR